MFERKSLSILSQWEESAQLVITPDLKAIINTNAIVGAIVCFLPLFGFESIFYAIVLWNMYHSISKKVGIPFSFTAIVSGFIINILICIVAGLFDAFIGVAWIISALIMYFLTYKSGETYLGLLFNMYKNDSRYQKNFRNANKVPGQICENDSTYVGSTSIPPAIPQASKGQKLKKSAIICAIISGLYFLCKWWEVETNYVETKHDFIFGDYSSTPISHDFANMGCVIFGLGSIICLILLIVRFIAWATEKKTKIPNAG